MPTQAVELMLLHNKVEDAINFALDGESTMTPAEAKSFAESNLAEDIVSKFLVGLKSMVIYNER